MGVSRDRSQLNAAEFSLPCLVAVVTPSAKGCSSFLFNNRLALPTRQLTYDVRICGDGLSSDRNLYSGF